MLAPIITFTSTAPVGAVVGGVTYHVTATSPSPATIVLTIDSTTTSICSISAGIVSFTAVGTCKIDANQVAGTNWNAAVQVQQSVTVGKGTPTIAFTSTAPVGAVVGGSTYSVTAFSPSPATIVFSIDATTTSICSISGNVVSFLAVGTCKIDVNQAAGTNWNAAVQKQQSFAVAATVPGKPTGVIGTAGKGKVTVSWTAPAINGGAAIDGYTVTSSTGGRTCSPTLPGPLTCTVTGLTPGTSYTFTVTAHNSKGSGASSLPSAVVKPLALTVPGAPTAVSGVGLSTAADVRWTAPADDGGSAITGYKVTSTPSSKTCTTTGTLTCRVTGLLNHTAYTFKVTATNAIGTGAASTASTSVIPRVGATFVALTPSRILDSKTGLGLTSALKANVAATFQVTGKFASDPTRNVPSNASAVTGVFSVSGSTAAGWVALTTVANNAPGVATVNINFPKGDSRSSGVTVPLGTGGAVWVTFGGATTGNTVQVSFDVTGYFVTGTSGSTYLTLTPNRLLDSRGTNGGMSGGLTAGVHRNFQVTGRNASDPTKFVPASAIAVTGTLTVTGQTKAGFLSLGPDALNAPTTATIYFPTGDTRSASVTVKLGAGGILSVTYTAAVGATTNVIFDVTGFFVPGTAGAMYVPLTPARILNTPTKLGLPGSLRANIGVSFQVTGRGSVPTGVVAVTGTLSCTKQTAAGYLALTKTVTNAPSISTLNVPVGDLRSTGVTVPLGTNGILGIVYSAASGKTADAIFDVTGYFVM